MSKLLQAALREKDREKRKQMFMFGRVLSSSEIELFNLWVSFRKFQPHWVIEFDPKSRETKEFRQEHRLADLPALRFSRAFESFLERAHPAEIEATMLCLKNIYGPYQYRERAMIEDVAITLDKKRERMSISDLARKIEYKGVRSKLERIAKEQQFPIARVRPARNTQTWLFNLRKSKSA